jgi:hypothetical protein
LSHSASAFFCVGYFCFVLFLVELGFELRAVQSTARDTPPGHFWVWLFFIFGGHGV